MAEPTDKEFMRVREVAMALGVKTAMVYRLVKREEIPSRRVGKLYLVPRAWVEGMRKVYGEPLPKQPGEI